MSNTGTVVEKLRDWLARRADNALVRGERNYERGQAALLIGAFGWLYEHGATPTALVVGPGHPPRTPYDFCGLSRPHHEVYWEASQGRTRVELAVCLSSLPDGVEVATVVIGAPATERVYVPEPMAAPGAFEVVALQRGLPDWDDLICSLTDND